MNRPLAALLLGITACATGPIGPITTAQLHERPGAAALASYLAQADASGDACARVAAALPAAELQKLPGRLLEGLRRGTIQPATFTRCAQALWPVLPAAASSDLATATLAGAMDALRTGVVDEQPSLQAQLAALQEVYADRPAAAKAADHPRRQAMGSLNGLLRKAPAGSPTARAAAALLALVELEGGRSDGRPVDPAALAARAAAGDEPSLWAMAHRLPNPALRTEAERQLVRVRIARSPFPEVQAAAAQVEAAVLRDGVNALDAARHPVRGGHLDLPALPARTLLVRQQLSPFDPAGRTTLLLGTSPERPQPSVLPALPLHGALWIEVDGLGLPVTVCEAGRPLDPSPCLASAQVAAGHPLVRVEGGAVRLEERPAPAEVAALARGGDQLAAALLAGGREVARVGWPVVFERPGDLVFAAPGPGQGGPDLAVQVERLPAGRLRYTVEAPPGGPQQIVLERADEAAFRVITRGGSGSAGEDGRDGLDGEDGDSGDDASCFMRTGGTSGRSGQDGQDGTMGAPGGPGGDGGDVRVVIAAPEAERSALLELVRSTVRTEGGRGGSGGTGGDGGKGGRGGRAGMGASCTDGDRSFSLGGGISGHDGRDGHKGLDGDDGPGGQPGRITHRWAAPDRS
ncbi:MAG: hypothetical protein QM767_19040 [Anaeromyxobacter sp.]